jgi:hypothetical protein
MQTSLGDNCGAGRIMAGTLLVSLIGHLIPLLYRLTSCPLSSLISIPHLSPIYPNSVDHGSVRRFSPAGSSGRAAYRVPVQRTRMAVAEQEFRLTSPSNCHSNVILSVSKPRPWFNRNIVVFDYGSLPRCGIFSRKLQFSPSSNET